MYNFGLKEGESLFAVFDDVLIEQENNQKVITVALTDKRILFLDYQPIEPLETLKGAHASSYIKMKEVVFQRELSDIKKLDKSLKIIFNDNSYFSFDNLELFEALKELIY